MNNFGLPIRDDRLAACAREAVYASQGQRVRSSLPDGAIFNAFTHHFVAGYYQMSLRDRRAAPAEHPLPGTILAIDQQKRRPLRAAFKFIGTLRNFSISLDWGSLEPPCSPSLCSKARRQKSRLTPGQYPLLHLRLRKQDQMG